MNRLIITLVALLCATSCSKSDSEGKTPDAPPSDSIIEPLDSDYYTPPTNYAEVIEFESDNDFGTDDSADLQEAIDKASASLAGLVKIPKGNYSLAYIEIKSNVTIEIDHEAIIRPAPHKKSEYRIFTTKGADATIQKKNFCVKGVGGNFTIDLRPPMKKEKMDLLRCFWIANASNFMISNADIYDQASKYASVVLNAEEVEDSLYGPTLGVVKNINNYGAGYGYGLVQMQFGQNILYKNLYAKGGTTLRLESHTNNLKNNANIKAIDAVVGYDIRSENGHSAVQLSPHFVKNGWVEFSKISGVSSEYTLLVSGGFVTTEEKNKGLTPGYFSSKSKIREISGVSGVQAQIHPKHFDDVPPAIRGKLPSKSPFEAKSGISLGVVLYAGDFYLDFDKDDIVKQDGFLDEQLIVTGGENEKHKYE